MAWSLGRILTPGRRRSRHVASVSTAVLAAGLLGQIPATDASAAGLVGSGFTVTTGDLSFILKQIKIAERHTMTRSATDPCGTLLNKPGDLIPDNEQVPNILTSYGLRTVDGTCNNLKAGNETLAAADVGFPRLTQAAHRDAEPITAAFPVGTPGPTSYKQKIAGNVVIDSEPRVVSNLIVDQTSTNPAAVAAAGHQVRSQNGGASTAVPCTTDPQLDAVPAVDAVPANCTPSHQTLFIPNVTTDVGLSPPYNSLFTFFGQFFDHGVDQTVKTRGAIFVPLKGDDPLIAGPDHVRGNADDLPVSQRFMVLTRAGNQPGPDGQVGTADDITDATNTDTPWVDQSQTYSSHASHQVFLREYAADAAGHPLSTGRLLGGMPAGQTYPGSPDGRAGISTWASVKDQSARLLGLQLLDKDVTDVPMIAADPYGKFVPGPARGLPQYVTTSGLVEGDLANPVPVPPNAVHFDVPFLTDIANNSDPSPQDTDHNPATPRVAPTPDADNTPSADFARQPAGTYDNEMLNAHFTCGDGRCNENIALTTVHQVFHSEHDRLVADIDATLKGDTSPAGVTALAKWQDSTTGSGYTYGERLFQAARFVTEMEYQHTVFEEFGRKMQPLIRPFHVYTPDTNAAVSAEFAHAVYRFGHSMLDDTVVRTNVTTQTDGSVVKNDNSLSLLDAFLNPPSYFDGGNAGVLTPEAAAGSIVMGSSSQVGNELDEFVTDTLRNNLLGLPLDLATLNIARARDTGVPRLNEVRREIFAQTNDGQLTPYTSWSDLGQHLKHPESLVNFVAAYGHHPSITSATTAADKRAAAHLLVDPSATDVPPADAADFMYGTVDWADDANGITTTGVDDVDLWVGGLAEITNLFGGLLGSTFNYVFQNQMEDLQDGDRFYYLARTPGLNLRAQLEGNSFSELIQRNTENTDSLKADAFATADCRFQLGNLSGTAAGFAQFGATVADDPTTDCAENLLLKRQPNGTIQYRQFNSVDPSGINGQAVYTGTPRADRVFGGNDNDTFWGDAGNDVIEGNGGDDVALGGDGNDIISDLSGADVLKGGPGNDAIDAGPGDDITMGGEGQDFLNGGSNDNEHFAGPGNDFIMAGQGADTVFGDGGDDWIQGGTGQDLLQGDHGAPFFDDPGEPAPGNDIFIGQVGENDYDGEGGDDIMTQNAAVDRNVGSGGFDWAIHQYDTVGADDDLLINNNLVGVPIQVVVNRDRWQEVEGDSGSALDDVLKGTDLAPNSVGGAGFIGCNVLDQRGVDRIAGLAAILPQPLTGDPAPVIASSAAGSCPIVGPVWGDGDILLGGGGSDTITGRGADDVIDGDRALTVRISVRTNPADPASEIGTTDLMERPATRGSFGPGTTGMTLQQAVFKGLVDPGNLVAVREITGPAASDAGVDTAVFSGPLANYSITSVGGVVTVNQTGANVVGQKVSDGIDTLRNIEVVQFSDQSVSVRVPGPPTIGAVTAGLASATVRWTAPPAAATTSYEVVVSSGGSVVRTITGISATATSTVVTGLVNGTSYTFQVRAVNLFGSGVLSASSNAVTPAGLATAPTNLVAVAGNASAVLTWTPPANDGGSPITGYEVSVRIGAAVVRTDTVTGAVSTATITDLANGTTYKFLVRAVTASGLGAVSAASNAVLLVTVPAAPLIGTAVSGPAGGGRTAVARWSAPPTTGGRPIQGYRIAALRMAADGVMVLGAPTFTTVGANARTRSINLPAGTYRFEVVAFNSVGNSPASARSNAVLAR
ncbi:MAG: fibronectin type III domain-containing protein [Actinomycetota bacterium]|nr:fibronectin type III domain-containing protein [Actinomycetota bacterium]